MKNLAKTKLFIYGTYILLVLTVLLIGFVFLSIFNPKDENSDNSLKKVFISFFETAENRTFDYRQSIKMLFNSTHKNPSSEIVVLEIDDATVEMLGEKYGEWPISRSVYADLVKYIEQDKPKAIIFDLMFLKSIKAQDKADGYFVDTLNKYNNIYTGINFDYRGEDVRKPIDLPKNLEVNINNASNTKIIEYKNCRPILKELIESKNIKVASTNAERDDDGIMRKVSPVIKYKDKYYPYLAFKAGLDILGDENNTQLYIDDKNSLIAKNVKIPLTNKG